jgi:hypothetical protein
MPEHHRIQWWPSSKPVKDGPERFIRGREADASDAPDAPYAKESRSSNGHTFKAEPALRWLRGERTLYSSRSSPFNLHQHPAGTEISHQINRSISV